MHESQLFAAQIRRKKNWKKIVFFLNKITFEPDTPGTWKRGKRAKWFVPRKIWPGVAPRKGHFQKSCRNRQRQNWAIRVVQMKKTISWRKLVQILPWAHQCTRNWLGNKTVLHVRSGNTTPSHWYLAKTGQKHQKWPTGSDRKRHFRCGSWTKTGSKYTHPTYSTVFYNSVLHSRGATTGRSKDVVTFWSKKCNLGYLTGQKGGISPHTGKPEKSCLLRFLIISEYDAPQKVWKKSYGSFSRTRPHFGFWLLRVKAWLGGRSGPLPAPKSPKIPQKEAAT